MNEQILHFFNLSNPLRILPLTGGGNNRVFKVEFESQSPVIIKEYFSHPEDPRPRLLSEFSFLQHARKSGILNIPEPLAFSRELNAAVYSFIPGKAIQPSDITDALIHSLIDFFLKLNKTRETRLKKLSILKFNKKGPQNICSERSTIGIGRAENKSDNSEEKPIPSKPNFSSCSAMNLSFASEACFTISDYLAIVDRRLEGLLSCCTEAPLVSFLNDSLLPKWIDYKNALSRVPFNNTQDFCISPSDFGFHNALINSSNEISFIDFEYAGIDDPCKTVCDLFCQPKIPLPEHYFPLFAKAFSSVTSDPESCLRKIQYLYPAVQMKWCCILLNVFTKIGKERRTFSQADEVAHFQLMKAKQLFSKIQDPSWPT